MRCRKLKRIDSIDSIQCEHSRAHKHTRAETSVKISKNTHQFGIASENHCIVSETNEFFFFVVIQSFISLTPSPFLALTQIAKHRI